MNRQIDKQTLHRTLAEYTPTLSLPPQTLTVPLYLQSTHLHCPSYLIHSLYRSTCRVHTYTVPPTSYTHCTTLLAEYTPTLSLPPQTLTVPLYLQSTHLHCPSYLIHSLYHSTCRVHTYTVPPTSNTHCTALLAEYTPTLSLLPHTLTVPLYLQSTHLHCPSYLIH